MTGFVLKRTDEALPMFFSLKVGRDYAAGVGGWAREMKNALRFARAADANAFADAYMKELAPFCQAVPYDEESA